MTACPGAIEIRTKSGTWASLDHSCWPGLKCGFSSCPYLRSHSLVLKPNDTCGHLCERWKYWADGAMWVVAPTTNSLERIVLGCQCPPLRDWQ